MFVTDVANVRSCQWMLGSPLSGQAKATEGHFTKEI